MAPRSAKKAKKSKAVAESVEESAEKVESSQKSTASASKVKSPAKSGRGRGRPKRDVDAGGSQAKSRGEGEDGEEKKKRKKNRFKHVINYSTSIHKIMKQIYPDNTLSVKSMAILCSFANDSFQRLAKESGKLAQINKKQTLTAREMQTAVRLLIPGELGKHAVVEGAKAVQMYHTNTSGVEKKRRDTKAAE